MCPKSRAYRRWSRAAIRHVFDQPVVDGCRLIRRQNKQPQVPSDEVPASERWSPSHKTSPLPARKRMRSKVAYSMSVGMSETNSVARWRHHDRTTFKWKNDVTTLPVPTGEVAGVRETGRGSARGSSRSVGSREHHPNGLMARHGTLSPRCARTYPHPHWEGAFGAFSALSACAADRAAPRGCRALRPG